MKLADAIEGGLPGVSTLTLRQVRLDALKFGVFSKAETQNIT